MSRRTCLYCNAKIPSPAQKRSDGQTVLRCENCGLLLLEASEAPKRADVSEFPKSSRGNAGESQARLGQLRWQQALLRLFNGPIAHTGAKLLDLGSGTGRFVQLASSTGFVSTGLERSPEAARIAREHGLPVKETSLEQEQLDQLDVITAWNFIEHVQDLRGSLLKIRQALREGGCFLFSTPDADFEQVRTDGNPGGAFNSWAEPVTLLTRPFLKRALGEIFDAEPALISFDAGRASQTIFGIARVGGLLPRDHRIAELLGEQGIPKTTEELCSFGAELAWFYLSFGQLEAAKRLIGAGEGILPADIETALKGATLFKAGQITAALPLLQRTAEHEPLLLSWLAESQKMYANQHVQEMQRSIDAQFKEAAVQRTRYQSQLRQLESRHDQASHELTHLRATMEQIKGSVTWKIGRGITATIERVPLTSEALSGLSMLRSQGPVATLQATQQYVLKRISHLGDVTKRWSKFRRRRDVAKDGGDLPASSFGSLTLEESAAPPSQRLEPGQHITTDPSLSRHRCLPLISVILPVFNQSDLVRESVESVLGQSYPNIELIILDDGSVEDIAGALQGLLDLPSVRMFRQPNQQLPRALTHAFQFAKGEFLTWTSADNLMAPQALTRLADALLNHPKAVLAYADVEVIDDKGQLLRDGSYRAMNLDPKEPSVIRLYRDDRALSAERDNFINACFLYRKSASAAMGHRYADEIRGAEDYDFWLRIQRCGRLFHIGNLEPLYSYRVHQRSMSHELVTQELAQHQARCEQLLDLERQRQDYVRQRWSVQLSPELASDESMQLRELLAQLPVDVKTSVAWNTDEKASQKQLLLMSQEGTSSAPLFVRVLPDCYQLVCRPPKLKAGGSERIVELPRGVMVEPLSFKARDVQPDLRNLPPAMRGRPVFGCHLPLKGRGLDLERLRAIIDANRWAYFMFLDIGNQEPSEEGLELIQSLENAGYCGAHQLGQPYPLYACFDWLLLPPTDSPLSQAAYLEYLALAYAIGRPLVLCSPQHTLPAPYQLGVTPDDATSLAFCQYLRRDKLDRTILDAHLDAWTPRACLASLLQHADAASQDWAVPQPEFAKSGKGLAPIAQPQPLVPLGGQSRSLRAVLLVDSLDIGGLEEVVAFLANNLGTMGIEATTVCYQRGGYVAERLAAQGHQVLIADGNLERLNDLVRSVKPDVINTHFTSLPAVESIALLDRPIIETIHNTYVYLTPDQWETERARSRYFTTALAVSGLVKRHYQIHNPTLPAERITVSGNAIDPMRIVPVPRREARRSLGIPEGVTLFASIGRYDAQKNQLGILRAFGRVGQRSPSAQLLFVGNVPEGSSYFEALQDARSALPCAAQVRIEKFRGDVSTLLSAADVVVMDSYYEGWSLAATEALLVGTPLIHSLCGSAEELCGMKEERGVIVPNPGGDLMRLDLTGILETAFKPQQNQDHLVLAMAQFIDRRAHWSSQREAISTYARRVFHPAAILIRYARAFRAAVQN